MKLISVNVGLPREVEWNGGTVATGIFKQPITGRIRVGRLNLAGDAQADLSVHGGPYKAVYAYPSEHYVFWRSELGGRGLSWGGFGENLTTEGMHENSVQIGDRYRIGTAELIVTQPRTPCYKLGIKFGTPAMIKRFLHSGRSGFYFAVAQEGELEAGDSIELAERARNSLSVAEVNGLYAFGNPDRQVLRQAAELEALPENWRSYFQEKLREMPA